MAKTQAKEKDSGNKVLLRNKRARHEYFIEETIEAGLVLLGSEVKSLRAGRAELTDAYAAVVGNEAFLNQMQISEYAFANQFGHAPKRVRKLLLHRQQIDKLYQKTREGGMTIVPLRLYFLDGRAKVEIALAKGKKEYDKRQTLRERQDKREAGGWHGLRVHAQGELALDHAFLDVVATDLDQDALALAAIELQRGQLTLLGNAKRDLDTGVDLRQRAYVLALIEQAVHQIG